MATQMDKKLHFSGANAYIIPIGGCAEFGMNITALYIDSKLFVIDVGAIFSDPEQLGVSKIAPNISNLILQFKKIEAYIITHGHEDHIGALSYIWQRHPAPIYASPWTAQLIKNKFSQRELSQNQIHTINPNSSVKRSNVLINFIGVNHSIPDACALHIKTPHASIFHTGDFKLHGDNTIYKNLAAKAKEICKEGLDLLIADSTNAHKKGFTPSEESVIKPLDAIIKRAQSRIFLSTFASNFTRLRTVADICIARRRHLVLLGRSMKTCFEMGTRRFGLKWPKDFLVDEKDIKRFHKNKLLILATGSQGEPRSAISRIVSGEHTLSIEPKDLFVFSARSIPGNEKAIHNLFAQIHLQGAELITAKDQADIHASGHGQSEDIRTLLKWLRPKTFLPTHGSFSHLLWNQDIAKGFGGHQIQTLFMKNGDVVQLSRGKLSTVGELYFDKLFIDDESDMPLDFRTLNERLEIGRRGLVCVFGLFNKANGNFNYPLNIQILGLPSKANLSLQEMRQDLEKIIINDFAKTGVHQRDPNESIKAMVRKYFFANLKKKPVVLSQIIEGA
mgnify:CR=1 FL=1